MKLADYDFKFQFSNGRRALLSFKRATVVHSIRFFENYDFSTSSASCSLSVQRNSNVFPSPAHGTKQRTIETYKIKIISNDIQRPLEQIDKTNGNC